MTVDYKAIVPFLLWLTLPLLIMAKPNGEYSTLGAVADYGAQTNYEGYQKIVAETPALLTSKPAEILKPAGSGTFEIGYGAPPPIYPIYPFQKFGFPGWKQPPPIIAPIQVIPKPIPIPVAAVPFGWGWPDPGFLH